MSMKTRWLQLGAKLYIREAPAEWVTDVIRPSARNVLISIALILCLQAYSNILTRGFDAVAAIVIISVVISLGTALFVHKAPTRGVVFTAIMFGAYLSVAFSGQLLVVFSASNDPIYRMRSHMLSVVSFKIVPGAVGFRMAPAILYIALSCIFDIVSLEACRIYHGDATNARMHLTSLSFSVGGLCLAIMAAFRLRCMFDVQEELASKKQMLESMISIMCDASVWLSENGGRVLQADHRFGMIVGRDLTGELVATAFAEEEQERFQDALPLAKTAPFLLPTTLLTHTGSKIPVEMFIVGNCDIKAAGQTIFTPAFLIGLKVAADHNETTEEVRGARMIPEAEAWALNLNDEARQPIPEDRQTASILSSAPETTLTGRIFDRENFERWGTLNEEPDEERAQEDLRRSLEKIEELAQKEHWLMSSSELQVRADQILGSGAFGVVFSGWLHGSPIAVKTTRRSADNASAKHLVSIANEIRIFRHLRHPNLVLFHGACIEPEEGEMMLVLERVKGPDLQAYVAEHALDSLIHKRLPLLLDVACALRYLHAVRPQVIHGDLKGSNVLVEAAMPRAKLVDFGLSRLLTKHPRPLGGTLNWMAPELICKKGRMPKPSADVFSFGRLAYLIVACKKPMGNLRPAAIEDMARRGVLPQLVWEFDRPLQRECSEMCRKLLSLRPEDRPTSEQAHAEASAWTLPDLDEKAPALELSRAAEAAAPPNGRTEPGGAMSSFRQVLSAALQQLERPAPPAPSGPSGPPKAGAAAGKFSSAMAIAGVPAFNPGRGQPGFFAGAMAQPRLLLTPSSTQQSMIRDMLMRWNFPIARGNCCKYHAALRELQRLVEEMMGEVCQMHFQMHEYQCGSCGVLLRHNAATCRPCEQRTTRNRKLTDIQEAVEEVGVGQCEPQAQDSARCSL